MADMALASSWLPNHPPVIGAEEGDGIPGTTYAVGRKSVSEAYDGGRPFLDESFFNNGVSVINLVPWGQLGEYWFVEDQPDMIYAVPFGTLVNVGRPVILEHIRNLGKKKARS